MSKLTFELQATRTSLLELKLGEYMIGAKGEQGADGQQGPEGTLTPEDEQKLLDAQNAAANSANQAAGSAAAAAQSATNAANSATDATNNGQAAANAAAASATAAKTSETNAANSANQAGGSASASAASAAAAKTSETNSAQWEALAHDWAVKLGATVDGTDYSAKYWAQACVASANAASTSATNAKTSETNSKTSETNAAASAAAAAQSAGDAAGTLAGALMKTNNLSDVANKPTACANLGAVKKTGDSMSGTLRAPCLTANTGTQDLANNQGAYLAWNENNGSGQLSLINNRAGAGGGFIFRQVNLNNTVQDFAVTIDPQGSLSGINALNMGGPLTVGGACNFNGGNTTFQNGDIWLNNQHSFNWNYSSGHISFRGDAGIPGGGFINNAGNAWLLQIKDGGDVRIGLGDLHIDNNKTLFWGNGAQLGTDGNVNGTMWGGWLSNWLNNQIGGKVGKTSGNNIQLGWGIRSSCFTGNVDNAWNNNIIMSQDNRWYSLTNYNSAGFIAISIDGDYGGGGNRSITTQASDAIFKDLRGASDVDALAALQQVDIVAFSYRQGEPEYQDGRVYPIGLNARQLGQVCPTTAEGEAFKTIMPNQVFAYLIKAIQQLTARVEELEGVVVP